ncbi:MAG: hypothetical protein GDA46_00595 [Bdellovibrionales bacterium]|nr:hypothetical protein [Bdellovibrionales bacterium]
MDIGRLREHIQIFQFNEMFEVLGWNKPIGLRENEFKINGDSIPYSVIAEINSVPVLKFSHRSYLEKFKSISERKKIHKKIKVKINKHLALFSDEENFFSLSYLSKNENLRSHSYFKGQSGDYFISKLAGIHFGIEDEPKIVEIANQLEKTFNTKEVTKRFFDHFKTNHYNFLKYIEGIENKEEKKWFASLILNRMMFIWFLQKKGFVNNDFDYLETKLQESQQREQNVYYSKFLTLLFFEGFAKKPKERGEEAKKVLGEIKYLNGGLFVPHSIEEKYKNKIKIQDKAFEETFEIFNKYDWSLQGKEGKPDNEISPDIMGYIFEKYINELQQKNLGAFYTRDEITSYLSRNTIQKCVLDKVNAKGYKFESIETMLNYLDANLCKLLLTHENSILNTLTVLDPAVGSGAFLVSALKELIDIYTPIMKKIETLEDRELEIYFEDFKETNKSLLYGVKKNIILKNLYGLDIMKEATEVCKLRLFLSLVSSALEIEELEPLPNIDFNIMCGSSLIGFLKEENEEQLQWDAVLGESYEKIKENYNRLVSEYKNKNLSFKKLKALKTKISNFLNKNSSKLNRILADKCNKKGLKYTEINIQGKKENKRMVQPEDFSRKEGSRNLNPFHWDFAFNKIIHRGGFDIIITNPPWEKVQLEDKEFFAKHDSKIKKKKTKKSLLERKKLELLKDSKIREDYYKTKEYYCFQRDYFKAQYQYQSGILTQLDGTEKKSSSDPDTYKLFTERCFELLNKRGRLGIVLPSGLHKDDGAVGLRKGILFSKVKIEGLIDFQNQMSYGKGKIFEGVHPQFKFLLLNLKKDKPQDEFPCQFMERDLKILDENEFPKNPKMKQSIKEIKKFSPRDLSIIEFKNLKDRTILKKARFFPELGKSIEGLWTADIYREFDETIDFHLFQTEKRSNDDFPLYKGSTIYQYEFNYKLSHRRYVSKNAIKVREGKSKSFKNKYYKNYRLVFRSIASNTNERTLISAVIPKNCFLSNTLHAVSIKSNLKNKLQIVQEETRFSSNNKYLLLLQSFFNSFVVDYFIRQKVSSAINKKYILPLHIPRLMEKDYYFKELVERSAKLTCIGKEFDELADEIDISRGGVVEEQERLKIQGDIDAIVAYIYGLTFDEFEYILSTFTTGRNQKRLQTLKEYALEAFKKDRFLDKAR